MPKPRLSNVFRCQFSAPGPASGPGSSTYLLDNYLANALAFYSTAKVTSDSVYSGDLVRQRVDETGQPEYDIPADTDGLFIDTADLLSNAGSSPSYITKRYNQVGNAFPDMVQNAIGQQMRIATAGVVDTLNSNPVMKNVQAGSGYQTALISEYGSFTIIIVTAHNNESLDLFFATDGFGAYGYRDGSELYRLNVGGTAISSPAQPTPASNSLMIVTFVIDGANSSIRVNGVEIATGNLNAASASRFDEAYVGGGGLYPAHYAESLWFDANLGTTAIEEIEADRMSSWGIA